MFSNVMLVPPITLKILERQQNLSSAPHWLTAHVALVEVLVYIVTCVRRPQVQDAKLYALFCLLSNARYSMHRLHFPIIFQNQVPK
jgi:hypothetical protein